MSRNTIIGAYYLDGDQLNKSEESNFEFDDEGFQLYEVMRCSHCCLAFEKDHLLRLEKGLRHFGYQSDFPESTILVKLKKLIEVNNCASGNIKLYTAVKGEELRFAASYIPHYYPSAELYSKGVQLKSFRMERIDPVVKQVAVSSKIQSSIKKYLGKTIYEALLIDKEGNITEGSKSNFFLVKGNELYSAPEEDILAGITRKYVLDIAQKMNIDVHIGKIKMDDLRNFQAAFICGTSPKVLPVNRIDFLSFNPEHPLITKLITEYNKLLDAQAGK